MKYYCSTTGSKQERTFLKKSAIPSVFSWMKSKTAAQLAREERELKRHEGKMMKLAEEWSTDQAKKMKKKKIYCTG